MQTRCNQAGTCWAISSLLVPADLLLLHAGPQKSCSKTAASEDHKCIQSLPAVCTKSNLNPEFLTAHPICFDSEQGAHNSAGLMCVLLGWKGVGSSSTSPVLKRACVSAHAPRQDRTTGVSHSARSPKLGQPLHSCDNLCTARPA